MSVTSVVVVLGETQKNSVASVWHVSTLFNHCCPLYAVNTHICTHTPHTNTHTRTHTRVDAPKVTTFTTTQNNTNVTGTHVGNNITMTCEAHGYPDLQLEINGPIAFQNSTHKPRPYDNWYLKRRAFLLSNLTEGYSGEYTCEASIQVTQGGETAAIKGGGEIVELVVYS